MQQNIVAKLTANPNYLSRLKRNSDIFKNYLNLGRIYLEQNEFHMVLSLHLPFAVLKLYYQLSLFALNSKWTFQTLVFQKMTQSSRLNFLLTLGEPFFSGHKNPSNLHIFKCWTDSNESNIWTLMKTVGGWKTGPVPMLGSRTEGKLSETERVCIDRTKGNWFKLRVGLDWILGRNSSL